MNISGPLVSGFSNLPALSHLNLSHNLFNGSISDDIANCIGLATLDLSSNLFSSVVPHGLAQLSNLQLLNLGGNLLSGALSVLLPNGCAQLQALNLSGNFFSDYTSYPWQNCTNLQYLDLSHNALSAPLPNEFSSLRNLQHLLLGSNQIVGYSPNSLCSTAGSLLQLNLSQNNLTGTFPLSLTNCSSLQQLDLSMNQLTGNLPPELGNLSSLELLDLSQNSFVGSLPPDVGRLSRLQVFMAGSNNLTGFIPSELRGCQNLILLDLNTNYLGGTLPSFLNEMQSLRYVVLHSNGFSGPIPLTLTELSGLQFLDLSNNSLTGSIPNQLANVSSLQFLLIAANGLRGEIPPELGNITGLQFLDFSSNMLTGSIPSSIGKLQDLLWLMLANNSLTGQIPHELGNCTSLFWLNARANFLSGELPPELANMGSNPQKTFDSNAKYVNPPQALGQCLMMKRWIPENYPPYSFVYQIIDDRARCKQFWMQVITGSTLPPACANNTKLGGYIQLTQNFLTGSIPEFMQANQSAYLLLGVNALTGSLPDSISKLPLYALNVSHNNLTGPIPVTLGDNKCLTLLDLSYNKLNGSIPESLGSLNQLSSFNVSYNPYLTGAIPAVGQLLTFNLYSYVNDSLLCLVPLPGMRLNVPDSLIVKPCDDTSNATSSANDQASSSNMLSSRSLTIIGVTSCLGLVLTGALGSLVILKWPVKVGNTEYLFEKMKDDDFSCGQMKTTVKLFKNGDSSRPAEQLTYADILMATNNFDQSNVLGCGGSGVVYKAKLVDGSTVAIKKLVQNGPQGGREFMAEMETLGTVAHENMVPLLGCCVFGSEKLLIYKYLPNGSLDDWLHEKQGGAEMLTWSRRLRVACGCAKGLQYLHHDCSPVLIHRDMKASNILLDEEFNGYLTDFGLARELDPGCTHVSTMIAGTLGYVPPEYCQAWRATTKGDVYSFGVVLLELITGRRPLSSNENENGNLVEWVRLLLNESRAAEAYHPVVKETAGKDEVELCAFLELANACTKELPDQRPSMQEVAKALEKMQDRWSQAN